MERTLVALWFADIAGYSEHAAKDESGALRLV
jgi:class 3 adenylate cyclase